MKACEAFRKTSWASGLRCFTWLRNISNAFVQEQPGKGSAGLQCEPQSLQASCAVRERVTGGGMVRKCKVILDSSSQRLLGDQRSAQPNFLSWMLWWNPSGGSWTGWLWKSWGMSKELASNKWCCQTGVRLLRDQAQQGFVKPSLQKLINKQSRVAAKHHLKEDWDTDVV